MNQTVKRIVDILFQDTVENDETRALHEELMNNCQEHYQDLISRGLSEDEAVAEVVESLKGMKDVIGQYPKKGEDIYTYQKVYLLSDGSQIILRAYIKPTPSIASTQETINQDGENITINIKGRHDPVVVPRAVVVVESMCAFTLLDLLISNMSAKAQNIINFYK